MTGLRKKITSEGLAIIHTHLEMSDLFQEDHIRNGRGQQLYTVRYAAPQPQAVLVWHHGYGEHVGRMAHFFSHLAQAGIAVSSYDAHGHGNSEPFSKSSRAYVANFNDLVDDLEAFIEAVRKGQPPDRPIFVGGQSMGGLIAAHVACRPGCTLNGLVLSSALVDVEWTPVLRFQAKIGNTLARLFPRTRLVDGVRPEDMSPDAAVVKDYIEDKLNFVGKLRTRTSNELLKGFRDLTGKRRDLSIPVFAVHGDSDRCTSRKAVELLVAECSSADKSVHIVAGGYHELLLGPEKEEVIAMITDWLLQHSLPKSSQTPASRL